MNGSVSAPRPERQPDEHDEHSGYRSLWNPRAHVVTQAVDRGRTVSDVEIDTPKNRRTAFSLQGRVESVLLGDIREASTLEAAMEGHVIEKTGLVGVYEKAN